MIGLINDIWGARVRRALEKWYDRALILGVISLVGADILSAAYRATIRRQEL